MPQRLRILSSNAISSLAIAGMAAVTPAAHALDLATAAREALQYDSAFLSARQKAEADATRFGQGLGLLLPSAVASAARTRTDLTVPGGGPLLNYSNRYATSYSVQLTQPIFRLDRYAAFQQERERSIAGEANFAQARVDALLRVTQAYFDVLFAQDSLASVNAELKAISEQLEAAKRNFEVGNATVTDQQEAQARFDLATAKQIAAQNDLAVKRNSLAQLVGKPLPQQLAGLRTPIALKQPEPLNIDAWVDQAKTASFRVRAAESTSNIASSEVSRVVAADNLPSLDLVARRSRTEPFFRADAPNLASSETDIIGLELTVPLFNGGIALNKAKEVMALKHKAAFDLESERRNAEQLARTSFLGVLSGLTQIRAFEAAEKSSRLALESNLLGYEVGVRINIDVLNAQQQLFSTQRDLSKSRYDTLVNSLRLKGAVGALSEADIDEINGLLAN